jgi:hypothetical protein
MTLDEAFKKYDNDIKMKRNGDISAYSISWLKSLKVWGNNESRELGFKIPQFMIEDAKADDWEKIE